MTICPSCMDPCGGDVKFCPYCGYSEESPPDSLINLPVKSELRERYVIGKVLGSGSFGITYLGWDKAEKRKVAIKEFLPSEFATRVAGDDAVIVFKDEKKQKQFHDGLTKFLEEGQKLSKLPDNSGLVKVFDCFSCNKTAYIVMELLHGMTLAQMLAGSGGVYSPDQAIRALWPIVTSLPLAHSEGIIHGDISPENIFMASSGEVKLIGFAAARFATTSHSRSLMVVVTSGYSPEEQYRSTGDQGAYTDVYALAAVFYRLIRGAKPPDALERRISLEQKKKDIITPLKGFTQANAIMNALNVRTQDRTPDMAAFASELNSATPVRRTGNKIKRIDLGRLPAGAKAAIFLCVALICAAGALFATGVIKFGTETEVVPEGMTVVPSVVNQDYNQAIDLLSSKGLQFSIIGKEYSGNIPADYVLYQDIAAGSIVNINTMVMITVSGGAEMGIVPILSGEDATVAKMILEDLGFVVKQEARFSQVLRAGLVIGTSEQAGAELAVGSTIVLYVSQGPSETLGAYIETVPNFVGLGWDDVMEIAEKAGFQIDVEDREYHDTIPEDHVIRQNLEPGSEQMNGPDNPILLIMSLGRHVVRVPNVRLETENDAKSLLETVGLRVGSVQYENSETVARDLVISHTPAAGTVVDWGSTVTIIVSSGKAPVPAPNVVGRSESEARSELTAIGLSVSVTYEFSQTAKDQVLRQSVSPGTLVSSGDSITITVSSGEDIRQIPNVIGSDRSSAENSLKNAGFIVSATEVFSDTVASGRIISQNPASGSSQVKGSTVYITVSKGPEPVILPDLINMQQSYAEQTLRNLGLVADVEAEFNNTVAKGLVFSQTPNANSSLKKGDTVRIRVSLGPKEGPVMDVTGLNRASAETILREQGFTVTVVEEFHSRIPKGNVISQSPIAGTTLSEGARVTITVSKGEEMVKVPNVTSSSMTQANAESILMGAGFAVSIRTDESTSVPKGNVISQSPTAGTEVAKGSIVTITVSSGIFVTVPRVTDMTQTNAERALLNDGYAVSVRTQDSSTVPEGNVITQSPAAGTKVEKGSIVTITVSTGSDLSLPNVVGASQASAESVLRGLGLVVSVAKVDSDTVPEGNVISQSPASGTKVAIGSTVTITVSNGSYVNVPNVVGSSQAAAENSLVYAGLIVSVKMEESATIPAGNVISQTPGGGTRVPKNSIVSITVSTGSSTTTVPNVTGFPQASAEASILNAELKVSVSTEESETVPAGSVIRQSPSAGTSVPKDSTVLITVSSGPPVIPDIIVPYVIGASQSGAESTLLYAGLRVSVATLESSSVPAGNVISQYPPAGTSVPVDSTVTITVSLGDLSSVTVPNVVGDTQAVAEGKLMGAELAVSVKLEASTSVSAGLVISQSPSSGTTVEKGSIVTITVSVGDKKVIPANIMDLPEEEAKAALTALGLIIDNVIYVENELFKDGRIVSMSTVVGGVAVLPGGFVDPGAHLNIFVNNLPEPPEEPEG